MPAPPYPHSRIELLWGTASFTLHVQPSHLYMGETMSQHPACDIDQVTATTMKKRKKGLRKLHSHDSLLSWDWKDGNLLPTLPKAHKLHVLAKKLGRLFYMFPKCMQQAQHGVLKAKACCSMHRPFQFAPLSSRNNLVRAYGRGEFQMLPVPNNTHQSISRIEMRIHSAVCTTGNGLGLSKAVSSSQSKLLDHDGTSVKSSQLCLLQKEFIWWKRKFIFFNLSLCYFCRGKSEWTWQGKE